MNKKLLFSLIFIFLFSFIIFWNALNNPFLLDDLGKILYNEDLKSTHDIFKKLIYPYYNKNVFGRNDPSRPLVYFIYTLLYQIDGPEPFWFHFFNAFIHGCNGVLVFLLSNHLLKNFFLYKEKILKPLLVSLLFICTPIQMSTAIYAYGLSDILAATWMILAFYFYFSKSISVKNQFFSILFMILGLLTKQTAIIIPLVFLLFDYLFNNKKLKKQCIDLIPSISVALIYLALRWNYFGAIGDLEAQDLTPLWYDYFFIQPIIIFRYLISTFFPFSLIIDHQILISDYGFYQKLASIGLFLGIMTYILIKYSRNKKNKFYKILIFSINFYLIQLIPTSSFFPTADIMVERRVYLANFGVFILMIQLLVTLSSKSTIGIISYIIFLSIFSFNRNHFFSNLENVWKNVVKNYPHSLRANLNLAQVLRNNKKFDQAKKILKEGLDRDQKNIFIYSSNLGTILVEDLNETANPEEAIYYFKISAQANPNFLETWYGMGIAYIKLKKYKEAKDCFNKSLEIFPSHVPSLNNLGYSYMNLGELDKSFEAFKSVLRYDPNFRDAIENIKYLCSNQKKTSFSCDEK